MWEIIFKLDERKDALILLCASLLCASVFSGAFVIGYEYDIRWLRVFSFLFGLMAMAACLVLLFLCVGDMLAIAATRKDEWMANEYAVLDWYKESTHMSHHRRIKAHNDRVGRYAKKGHISNKQARELLKTYNERHML